MKPTPSLPNTHTVSSASDPFAPPAQADGAQTSGVQSSADMGAPDVTPPVSAAPAASPTGLVVAIDSLQVNRAGDPRLFGRGRSQVSIKAAFWDDSGRAPMIYPPPAADIGATLNAFKGQTITFPGGISTFAASPVKGDIHYAILVQDVDAKSRAVAAGLSQAGAGLNTVASFGKPMATMLGPGAAFIGPSAAGVQLLGTVLEANKDDTLATYVGTLSTAPGGAPSVLTLDAPMPMRKHPRHQDVDTPAVRLQLSITPTP